jgi:hypothetical protein
VATEWLILLQVLLLPEPVVVAVVLTELREQVAMVAQTELSTPPQLEEPQIQVVVAVDETAQLQQALEDQA